MNTAKPRLGIGFTGTRKGLTPEQQETLLLVLEDLQEQHGDKQLQGHHGDTIGADVAFHELCLNRRIEVVVHPALDQSERAHCQGPVQILEPAAFGDQSDAIIRNSQILIGAPCNFKEILRGSGTWMTIRRARKVNQHIVLIFPDGRWKAENDV